MMRPAKLITVTLGMLILLGAGCIGAAPRPPVRQIEPMPLPEPREPRPVPGPIQMPAPQPEPEPYPYPEPEPETY